MATIRKRENADGTTAFQAIIRLKRSGKIIHQERKTFSREALAKDWAKRREVELERPGGLAKAKAGDTTIGALLKWYVEEFEKVSKWQRSKGADLKRLQGQSIAEASAVDLEAQTVVDFVRKRRQGGAGPATVLNDLVWLGVVLRAAKTAKGVHVTPEVIDQARETCYQLRLVAKSRRRERRPTTDELSRLREYFDRRDRRAEIPMRDIFEFALTSARRQAEICRLAWADNDKAAMTGIVRDAKHPRAKEGNHRRFKYTQEAWEIVERQPKTESPFVFPYDSKSVGAAFTRACQFLGIEDLHFHDLRHEATSNLFEAGYQIHEVAQFTLHDSWNELKRYTNLDPAKLKLRVG